MRAPVRTTVYGGRIRYNVGLHHWLNENIERGSRLHRHPAKSINVGAGKPSIKQTITGLNHDPRLMVADTVTTSLMLISSFFKGAPSVQR